MQRSPIERMIDQACGFDPEAPKQPEAWEVLNAMADKAVKYRIDPSQKNHDELICAIDDLINIWWAIREIGELE